MSATMTATLSMRDLMSSRLRTAERNVGRFARKVEAGRGPIGRFAGSLANMTNRISSAFGARALRLVRGFFTGLKISTAIGTIALGRFAAEGIAKAKELESTLRLTTALIASQADINASASSPFSVESRSALAQQRYGQLEEMILRISPGLAADPNKVAEGVYDIVSAGYEDLADIEGILTSATKAATAGRTTPEVAVKALVTTLQSYGAKLGNFKNETERAEFVVDQMFQAVNTGLVTFGELSENLGKVTGTAAQGGVSFEELMAAVQITTLKGLQPDVAITSLNRILTSMIAPSPQEKNAAAELFGTDAGAGLGAIEDRFDNLIAQKQAAIDAITDDDDMGSSAKRVAKRRLRSEISDLKEDLKQALKVASADSLRGVWGPQALAHNGLLGQLELVRSILKPTVEELEAIDQAVKAGNFDLADALTANVAGDKVEALTDLFGDIRGLRSALALTSEEGKTFEQALFLQSESLGAVNRAFDEQAKTAQFAEDQMKSYINVVRIKLGKEALPLLAGAARAVSGYIDENILSNPAFENAQGMDKFKVIGETLWNDIVGWWDENKDGIKTKTEDFFGFVAETAVPFAVSAAAALGTEMGPVLWDSLWASVQELLKTTEGGLLLTGLLGLKAAGGLGAAGAAAGGAGAAAGGAGLISTLAVGTLAVGTATIAVATLVKTIQDQVSDVRESRDNLRGRAKMAADAGEFEAVQAGFDASSGKPGMERAKNPTFWGEKILGGGGDSSWDIVWKDLRDSITERTETALASNDFGSLVTTTGAMLDAGIRDEIGKGKWGELTEKINTALVSVIGELNIRDNPEMIRVLKAARDDEGGVLGDSLTRGMNNDETVAELIKQATGGNHAAQEFLDSYFNAANTSYQELLTSEQERYVSIQRQIEGEKGLTDARIDGLLKEARAIEELLGGGLFVPGNAPLPYGISKDEYDYIQPDSRVGPGATSTPPVAPSSRVTDPRKDDWTSTKNVGPTKAMALGGFGTIRTPTTIKMGERGPEDFAVIPHVKGGLGRGGSGTSVTVQGPLLQVDHIDSDTDLDNLADGLVSALRKRVAQR